MTRPGGPSDSNRDPNGATPPPSRRAGGGPGASRFSSPCDAVSLKMTVGTVTGVLRLARRSQEAERLSLSCWARPGLPAACDGPGRASRAPVTRSRLHSISPRRLHGSSSRISASTEAAPINYLSFYNWQYSTILANEKNRVRFSSHLGTHYHPVSLKVTVLMARSLAISGWPGHRQQGRFVFWGTQSPRGVRVSTRRAPKLAKLGRAVP